MAKRKKRKSNRLQKSQPQHNLPTGFWSQIGALLLIAVSILFVVAWFGSGGPILEWAHSSSISVIGLAVYILPLLFIFLAVEIFRSENNQLPFVTKFASVIVILLFSGLFGLLKNNDGQTEGGLIGEIVNGGMLSLVDSNVASFIYVLLIIVTMLFILRETPFTVIKKISKIIKHDTSENEANMKIMRNVSAIETLRSSGNEIKVNMPDLNNVITTRVKPKIPGLSGVSRNKSSDNQSVLVTVNDPNWKFPNLELLENRQSPPDAGNIQQNAGIIKSTLREFDIEVDIEGANMGPRVTQYTLLPARGIKLDRIASYEKNLMLALGAQRLRIEAPIPGQKAVGIEVPNQKAGDVRLYSIIASPEWKNKTEPLTFAIGRDISGKVVLGELNDMPHLLIAGQTKAGKSVMINTLLTSLLYHNSPSNMKMILIDPKRVEMVAYQDIPHLITPVITEADKTISALKWCVQEMERRYVLLAENKVVDIKEYNSVIKSKGRKISVTDENGYLQQHENGAMPYVVIVIDELSDLKQQAPKDLESLIIRIAQKGRAAGLHLVIATQSPRKDVITGLIKANVPAKIAFSVSNQLESRIILDQNGADKLLGNGDMLLKTTDMPGAKRVQGALVTKPEVRKVMDYLRSQSPPQYNDEVISQPVHLNGKGGVITDYDDEIDNRYDDALRLVIENRKASTTFLQMRLKVGYAKAARIMSQLEERGIISPPDGARPREVLVESIDEINQINDNV